ncbi:MAG: SDR family oxidoreductase [Betaproteobacteria bacterium]|nr:SDR family oxidoreductase [Betaproteobacteria bacterium]
MTAKVAIVTGGSSGMGEAASRLLSKSGWRVAIVYSRNERQAEVVAGQCAGAIAVKCDVARDADCRKAAAQVLERYGRIDALVNNAGTTKFVDHKNLEGLAAEDFEAIFRVNLIGPFQMIRACEKALRESRGSIVNVSSLAHLLGTGSSIAYAASKAALNTMSFSLARALAPEIRVNVVAPGFVRTPWQVAAMGEQGSQEAERRYAERTPLKRAPAAEDVAETILWLLEKGRAMTGQLMYVDAGMHVASPR